MNNVNKKYDVGTLSLAEPYFHFIHNLPLLSFGDVMSSVDLSLVFNSKNKTENNFNITNGFKLNLQKRLIINTQNGGSTKISLEDENGMIHYCKYVNDSVYVVHDYGKSVLRKDLIGGKIKYILEYANMSKEIFDSNGNIESLVDKYNNVLLTYNYDENFTLKSIAYRTNKELNFEYTNEKLTAIKYLVKNTNVCTITITYNNLGVIVGHYSGTDFHIETAANPFVAYSTERNATAMTANCKKISCTKGQDIQFDSYNYTELVNSLTFSPLHFNGEEQFDLLDITDRNGVTTRFQYKNDKPVYSYEILSGTEDEQFVSGSFYRNVYIHQNEGEATGFIYPTSGTKMVELGYGAGQKFYYEFGLSEDFCYPSLITGWIKSNDGSDYNVTLSLLNQQGVSANVSPIQDKWTFFAMPFVNNNRVVELTYTLQGCVELKDVRFIAKTDTVSTSEFYLCNATEEYPVQNLRFRINEDTSKILEKGEVGGSDLLRYFINKTVGHNSNEFCCFFPHYLAMFTNVTKIDFSDGTNIRDLNNFSLEQRVRRYGTEVTIKLICDAINKRFSLQYCDQNGVVEQMQTYDDKCDLISASVNGVISTYSRMSNGLPQTAQEADLGLVTYEYDTACTKLLKRTDVMGVSEFLTDDIWGTTTQITRSQNESIQTQTLYTLTDDGDDITSATFGTNGNTVTNGTGYSDGKMTKLKSGPLEFDFSYTNSTLSAVSKNGTEIKRRSYADNYKNLTERFPLSATAWYTKSITKDNYGRPLVISDCIENTYAVEPFFDIQGNHQFLCSDTGSAHLSTQTDLKTNETTYFAYESNRISKAVTKQGENTIKTGRFLYDSANRQTKDVCSYVFNRTNKYRAINISYVTPVGKWNADERIGNFSYTIGEQELAKEIISYDAMKRPKTFTKNIGNIAYKKELVYNCGMVRSVTDTKSVRGIKSDLGTVEYTYDAAGRIVRATNAADGTSISYVYDSIGRLVRENNAQLNETYVYQYDAIGNVVSKKTYAFTENTLPASAVSQINFTYSSTDPDRLTSFGNKSISYDYQGCPISYSDKKYTWSSGKLSQIAIGDINIGRESFSYTYNGNGLRTKKTYSYMPPRRGPVPAYYIANKTTSYFYDHSGRLLEEHSTTTENTGSSETSDLVYFYDACGIAGFVHNGSTYYLHRNLHGDVESIFDSTGTLIASYRYDTWGNHKVYGATGAENTSPTFIGNVNPIRYRGYYFDVETNMYFCNARYYVPEWCRWLSQDSVNYIDPDSADGLNLFAYCNNNPVMYADPSGHAPILSIILGIAALIGLGLTVGGVASDNHIISALGLSLLSIAAAISGGIAFAAGFAGATYLGIIGGVTLTAGAGSVVFASAEFQHFFTGNNWLINIGMSENWYKGVMLTTATIAAIGTITCGILGNIGSATTAAKNVNQTLYSIENHPNRWKITKQLVEPATRKKSINCISTYTNYINKWTGGKAGIHKIVDEFGIIRHYHFHPLI